MEGHGGLSVCHECALNAYAKLNKEGMVGDSHYLCPLCEFDFGDIEELKRRA